MLSRRGFLKVASFLGVSSWFSAKANSPEVEEFQEIDLEEPEYHMRFANHEIRVLQGATDSSSTVLTVLAHREARLKIEVLDSRGNRLPADIQTVDMQLNELILHHVFVQNLQVGEIYYLDLLHRGVGQFHRRRFKALDLTNPEARIALLTCSSHRSAEPKDVMFQRFQEARPDAVFFAGDLIYANSSLDTVLGQPAEPHEAYNVYVKTWMELDLYNFEDLLPVFTTWDDHDLAFNNAKFDHPYKDTMLKMFRNFYPVSSQIKSLQQGPGISFCLEGFGLQIFFLDNRHFKNPKAEQMLGREQLDWVVRTLTASDRPIVLISSLQFLHYRSFTESFQRNAASEFVELRTRLRETGRPVLLISGDVHYSQIQTLDASWFGHPTFEVTSSAFFSLSARSYGKRSVQDGQLEYYGYPNFLLMNKISSTTKSLNFQLTCLSERSSTQFRRSLSIKAP
ncbi:MAG: alkaline phosphatase D family protein [Bdellovibrionales bacterium]